MVEIADAYEADEARFLSDISQLKQRLSSSEEKFAAVEVKMFEAAKRFAVVEVQHQKQLSEAEAKFAAAEVRHT